MSPSPFRSALLPLLAAAAAAACSSPGELEGAAAARSRGASVLAGEEAEAKPPGEASRPADPWLDDARVLARVNGRVLTLREVRHAMGPAYDQYLDRREDLARFVQARVKDLVIRRLAIEEARRIGFTVDDEDLERETERAERAAAEAGTTLAQTIRDLGMTRREWDDRTRDDILFQRALYYFTGQFPGRFYDEDRFRPAVDFFVRPGEIRAYGEKHREELGILRPAQATLRVLDLRKDSFRGPGATEEEAWRLCGRAVDAVEERLRAGESFADLARELSAGPEAPTGGLVGPFLREGPLRAEYREWAFREGRAEGDVSQRLRLPSGYVLLYMERLEPERVRPIEEWAPEARERLLNLKKTIAWNEVQIALLEEAAVSPRDLRDGLLSGLRSSTRRVREELE